MEVDEALALPAQYHGFPLDVTGLVQYSLLDDRPALLLADFSDPARALVVEMSDDWFQCAVEHLHYFEVGAFAYQFPALLRGTLKPGGVLAHVSTLSHMVDYHPRLQMLCGHQDYRYEARTVFSQGRSQVITAFYFDLMPQPPTEKAPRLPGRRVQRLEALDGAWVTLRGRLRRVAEDYEDERSLFMLLPGSARLSAGGTGGARFVLESEALREVLNQYVTYEAPAGYPQGLAVSGQVRIAPEYPPPLQVRLAHIYRAVVTRVNTY